MKDLLYWVWLSRVFPYASLKPRELVVLFGGAKEIYNTDYTQLVKTKLLKKSELESLKKTSLKTAEDIIEECNQKDIDIVPYNSNEYPLRLKNIINPPMVIYKVGDICKLDEEVCLSVVGTRKASEYGLKLTGNICYELAKAGVVIVSGCAVGIDTFAHLGAIKAGGKTIGILACGIDVNYPVKSKELKKAMLKKGALISEMPPGETASREIFRARNRLLSALCNGVMVTEAPAKSGALITAEHAIEQGRDLFCIPPHDIYNENFAGVSKYIRDGAIPVCSAKDVLLEYINAYPHKLNYEMMFNEVIKKKFKNKVDFDVQVSRKKSTNRVDKDDIINDEIEISQKSDIQSSARIDRVQNSKNPVRQIQKEKNIDKNSQIHVREKEKTDLSISIISNYGEDYVKVYKALEKGITSIDDIVDYTNFTTSQVMTVLTELELMNIVKSDGGSQYSI